MNLKTLKQTRNAFLGVLLFGSANYAIAQTTKKVQEKVVATDSIKTSTEQQAQETPEILVDVANKYLEKKDWPNALTAWKKVSTALPEWAPSYYSQGYIYQNLKENENAKTAFEKYISLIKPEEIEANKRNLSYAHLFVAFSNIEKNKNLAKQHITKSLEYDPNNQDAIKLYKALNP